MAECLEELEPPVSPTGSINSVQSCSNSTALSLSHLPPIKLPPFDGNYEDWEQFRDRFTALISENKDLSQFAKMHYLTSRLKSRASDCIANIPVIAENFDVAWKTLTARYESKRRLLSLHLSTLLNLMALPRESASDLQATK
ncbi:uncharacterized protein LOC109610706 [Ooceraea biroi]|uniref:Uncharacterized protein n=1 Tax=Ooceraea biroi TaxID=2015173 RepID=A0A026WUR7_OOCBI|nr:uncharacterized protein LOC109610706 [Ooceraea biroi]EZA59757.1 hypothetical protein X777_16238 [Ooceraea biroi]